MTSVGELWFVIRRMLRQRALLPMAILLTGARCALALWLPLLMAEAVDAAIMLRDLDRIMAVGLRMLGACIGMGLFNYGSNMLCALIGQRFALELREEAYQRISEFTVSQASRMGYGSLITRLTVDIDTCANLVNSLILLLLEPSILTVGGIAMMWRISPQMGLVFLGFVLLQLVIMMVFVRRTAPGFVLVRRMTDALNARLQIAFGNFRFTKATNSQASETEHVEEHNLALYESGFAVQRKIALFNPLVMLIMNIAVASTLWMAGQQISLGLISVSMVLSAINYSEQVLLSIASMGHIYRIVTETQPSAARVRQVLETAPDMCDGDLTWEGPFEELNFSRVGFAYTEGTRVFDNLSFAVHAGETLAVVGPIGCGKTTMAGLCARLYDATSGQVLLNGEDVSRWRLADVRRAVALVEKHTAVLEDTIRDNIIFGREGISEEDVNTSVKVAQLEEFLQKKPQGLDTPLYSMGRSLSGGERQRLTIARALAGKPGLLVLDDSTSSLDYLTEARLLDALRKTYPSMAVLIITNRLASALRADRIMVLSDGRVEAEGTSEELERVSHLYQRMCAIQKEGV